MHIATFTKSFPSIWSNPFLSFACLNICSLKSANVSLVVFSSCCNSVSLKVLLTLPMLTKLDVVPLPYKEYCYDYPPISSSAKQFPPNFHLHKRKQKFLKRSIFNSQLLSWWILVAKNSHFLAIYFQIALVYDRENILCVIFFKEGK